MKTLDRLPIVATLVLNKALESIIAANNCKTIEEARNHLAEAISEVNVVLKHAQAAALESDPPVN